MSPTALPDLFALAHDVFHTREERRRWVPLLWFLGVVSCVAAFLVSAPLLIGDAPEWAPMLTIFCAIALLIVLMDATSSARLSRAFFSFRTTIWTISFVITGLAALVLVCSALLLWTPSAAQQLPGMQLVLGAVALLFLLMSATVCAPLLSSYKSPRLWQAKTNCHLGAACAISAIVAASRSVLDHFPQLTKETEGGTALAVVVPAALTLIAGVMAWHNARLRGLERRRQELLRLLDSTIEAVDPRVDAPGQASWAMSMRRLQSAISAGPFRASSPFAPPATASWEIELIVAYVVARIDGRELPRAAQRRKALFRAANDCTPEQLREPMMGFLAYLRERLINPSAQLQPEKSRSRPPSVRR